MWDFTLPVGLNYFNYFVINLIIILGGPAATVHSLHGDIHSYSKGFNVNMLFTWMLSSARHSGVFRSWQSRELSLLLYHLLMIISGVF